MNAEVLTAAGADIPTGWRLWWLGARPRTLTMSAAPVAVGTCLAHADGAPLSWLPLLLALFSAVMIQAGTNLHNDCADFERGNDGPGRLGPVRVTAAGWATPTQTRRAAHTAFALAFAAGIALVWLGGWPILLLGLASLAAGYAYSGGPLPISHTPFGEAFVLAFFGLVAVGGSAWLQAGRFSAAFWPAGLALGAVAAAVLMVNNLRDVEADSRAGRRTLAALLGRDKGVPAYAFLMFLPHLCLYWLWRELPGHPALFLALATLPLSLRLVIQAYRATTGTEMNALLAATAKSQLPFALLLSLGLLA